MIGRSTDIEKLASLIDFVEEHKVETQKRQKDYYDRR